MYADRVALWVCIPAVDRGNEANCRKLTDHARFQGVPQGIAGHTLTYDRLTGQGVSHDGQTSTERV